MQKSTRTLQKLLQLKTEATQKIYQQLLHTQNQFQHAENRQQQLTGYRLDYLQQMDTIGKMGGTLGQLKNRVDFVNNLDSVLLHLSIQKTQVEKQLKKLELAYRQAQEAEKIVIKLIERKMQGENSQIKRAEQKENDERAQNRWYTQRSISQNRIPFE